MSCQNCCKIFCKNRNKSMICDSKISFLDSNNIEKPKYNKNDNIEIKERD